MMEIHFRQLLFEAGEREHKMNKKNPNSKKKLCYPRPKKETTESKELNFKDKKKICRSPTKKSREKNAKYPKTSNRLKKKFYTRPENEEGIIRTRKSRRRHEKKK